MRVRLRREHWSELGLWFHPDQAFEAEDAHDADGRMWLWPLEGESLPVLVAAAWFEPADAGLGGTLAM
jgi:hypothetical protein